MPPKKAVKKAIKKTPAPTLKKTPAKTAKKAAKKTPAPTLKKTMKAAVNTTQAVGKPAVQYPPGLARLYLEKLKPHLPRGCAEALEHARGVTPAQSRKLAMAYPGVTLPRELTDLLAITNGTSYGSFPSAAARGIDSAEELQRLQVSTYALECKGCVYELLSVAGILTEHSYRADGRTLDEFYGKTGDDSSDSDVDFECSEEVDRGRPMKDLLPFADDTCGSTLYLDFHPTAKGTVGQVVRYVHDPDVWLVAARGLGELLQSAIDSDFEPFVESMQMQDEYGDDADMSDNEDSTDDDE